MSIKYIDIGELRQVGFLQEANRLFFHPHGLALEVTSVDEDGDGPQRERIRAALAGTCGLLGWAPDDPRVEALARAVGDALFPAGSMRLSGVWDYRDDPEGILFGLGGYGDSAERAAAVAVERDRHREARTALFGGTSDVEPLDYVYQGQGLDA